MKKIRLLPVLLLFVFGACSSQEAENHSRFYVQIEDIRFYLRYSHRNDVEAFLGSPSTVYFFEHGGNGFYWSNFTLAAYKEGYLRFYYNSEGDVIRVVLNANYGMEIFILGRSLNELNHTAVSHLLGLADIRIFHTTEHFIGSIGYDFEGNRMALFFDFNDESNITWLDMYYEEPWYRWTLRRSVK